MRVLMFSLDPNILHPERDAGKRMEDYATLVDELTIILFSTGGEKQVKGNLTIYPTARNKPVSFLKGVWISYRELRKGRYDLMTLQEPFILSLISFPLAHLFRLPLEVQVHSTFFSPFWKESPKNTFYQFLARVFVPHATCIRAVSERIKKDLLRGLYVSEPKITVLPIFRETRRIANTEPQFDLHAKYPQFDFIALMASRLVKQKNIDLAIDAFRGLIKKHSRMGLVILGAGSHEEELKERSAGITRNIIFEGWSDDLPSYYKGADVFLLTSNYEGWAMTVIEAMAAGTAVVMTDVGCAGEVVHGGENGIVIPVGDQSALEDALKRLYRDPEGRERLALAGQKTALHLVPRTKEEYLALYKKNWQHCIEVYTKERL